MRASEFQRAVADEFGAAYGAALVKDLVLGALGDRTAAEALAAGAPPKQVWLELCREAGVPEERRHGVGRIEPRK
ncbi:hypothetical protein USB125703_02129 [Pseudoclavibacter triregionum]|nr:hypothetical protein USB125703_02129 [Pseudoclavibacter triregionum]